SKKRNGWSGCTDRNIFRGRWAFLALVGGNLATEIREIAKPDGNVGNARSPIPAARYGHEMGRDGHLPHHRTRAKNSPCSVSPSARYFVFGCDPGINNEPAAIAMRIDLSACSPAKTIRECTRRP